MTKSSCAPGEPCATIVELAVEPRCRRRSKPRCQKLRLRALPGMQMELLEFFAQRETGKPEPTRGLRLVALSEEDGLRDNFTLGLGQRPGMRVVQFTPLRAAEQSGHQRRQCILCRNISRTSGQGGSNRVRIDRKTT